MAEDRNPHGQKLCIAEEISQEIKSAYGQKLIYWEAFFVSKLAFIFQLKKI